MSRHGKSGQSTLEYLLVLIAIIGAIVAASAVFSGKVQSVFGTAGQHMTNAASKLGN